MVPLAEPDEVVELAERNPAIALQKLLQEAKDEQEQAEDEEGTCP